MSFIHALPKISSTSVKEDFDLKLQSRFFKKIFFNFLINSVIFAIVIDVIMGMNNIPLEKIVAYFTMKDEKIVISHNEWKESLNS